MFKRVCLAAALLAVSAGAFAQGQVVNLYSARHYATDEALYKNFTKATGITINRVDSDDASILARVKSEGTASPADVILMVDAARLYSGEKNGLFQPIKSPILEAAIPESLRAERDPSGGIEWFGFSTRARIVVYDKMKVKADDVDTYEKLADPRNKGRICIRSGSHPYNLSLFSALYEHLGAAKTEEFLKGLKANLARNPTAGDTEQIMAVAAGECSIAVTNSYYLARVLKSDAPADRDATNRLGIMFPNQATYGTHVNIAGAAVAKYAKNRDNAIKFLEYLASPEAQNYFANGNNEWPAAKGVYPENRALKAMTRGSTFKSETIPVGKVGANQQVIQQMLDRVGFN